MLSVHDKMLLCDLIEMQLESLRVEKQVCMADIVYYIY